MTRPEAHIAAYGLAYPPMVTTSELLERMAKDMRKAGKTEGFIRKVGFICKSSKINSRPVSLASYHVGTERANIEHLGKAIGTFLPAEQAAYNEERDMRGEERNELWKWIAPRLAIEAAKNAMKGWSGKASEITHVITTSTSGWQEPGIASNLIHHLGLSQDTQKCELNFNGCFCGMTCLRIARDVVRSGDDDSPRCALVVACELASLHFTPNMTDSDLLAASLFSDGCAAFIVGTQGPWKFKDAGMSTVPNSMDLLGLQPYGPLSEPQLNGAFRMNLSPQVSNAIASYFATGPGNERLSKILAKNCGADSIPDLAVHPGGPRILDTLQASLIEHFPFERTALDDSFHVLHTYGNLGSVAILYVLHHVFSKTTKRHVVTMAFGPGVTFEWGAFERV